MFYYIIKEKVQGGIYMGKRVDFYTMTIYKNGRKTDYKIDVFLDDIGNILFGSKNDINKTKSIAERQIRLFSYFRKAESGQVVLPFGKQKQTNKPFMADDKDNLEEIPRDLYDVNSLGYDKNYNIAVFTTNNQGPTIRNVEEYLNSFIPDGINAELRIEPINYNAGIESVRNAELVKCVTFNLDLGQSLNNFYIGEIENNRDTGLINAFRNIAESSKNTGESRTLSLSMGLGHNKRSATLNINSMLYLLEKINIEASFVKEIIVTYKNGTEDPIDFAKLKNSNILLSHTCKCNDSQVTPSALINNFDDAIANKIAVITRHLREFYVDREEFSGDNINIVIR